MTFPVAIGPPGVGWRSDHFALTTQPPRTPRYSTGGSPCRSTSPLSTGLRMALEGDEDGGTEIWGDGWLPVTGRWPPPPAEQPAAANTTATISATQCRPVGDHPRGSRRITRNLRNQPRPDAKPDQVVVRVRSPRTLVPMLAGPFSPAASA